MEDHLLLLRLHLGSICHLFYRRTFPFFCFPTLNETFSCRMWVYCKWRLQGSDSPSLNKGAAPTWCDVQSWHTRQRFAKPLYSPGHRSPISFTLPHLCVSITTNQVCLSVIINVQYWIFILFLPVLTGVSPNPSQRMFHLMLLQENVSVGAEKKRSSFALTLCLQLSCQSHSSWFGPGHWCFSHQKADLVHIKQLPH